MKNVKVVVLIISLFLVFANLSGCGSVQRSNYRDNLMKLNIGDSKERVLELMGQPIRRDAYPDKEFLIYNTEFDMNRGIIATPIKLVNGKVVGWGQNYIDEAANKNTQTIDLNVKQR